MSSLKINTYMNIKKDRINNCAGATMLEFCQDCTYHVMCAQPKMGWTHFMKKSYWFILTAEDCQFCLRTRQTADISAAQKPRRLQKLFDLNIRMIHLIWSVANFYNGSCHYGQWPLQLACIIIFHKDLPRAFLLLLQLGTSWATKNVKKINNLLCIMRLLIKKNILCS